MEKILTILSESFRALYKKGCCLFNKNTFTILTSIFICGFLLTSTTQAQNVIIKGVVRDAKTNETVIGASIGVKGTSTGALTDLDGKFELEVNSLPVTLVVSFVGYKGTELIFKDASKPVSIQLQSSQITLKEAQVTGSRITEKQKEAPLTIESMDRIAIKECAQTSFYEALGTMKGVDLTTASLGFTVINTRGFNSTSPVRSLQLIDGVDNQSPGLNFSLGNFLGASELDVLKVDLISGASSAYYGPNAFNGVISMTTRSPFVKPGLEVSAKVGERNLLETSVRWAQVLKNKAGEEKFGYKVNLFFMKANDWEANNLTATPESRNNEQNPGGYDAVNIYGDEYYPLNNRESVAFSKPGIGTYYRTGYAEKDLVDYNTNNLKLGVAFHYKLKPDVELIYASNFGNGTTVYQGDNRYSLKDILFFQNRIELRKQDKFFIRAYATNEDAGKSYDAYFTALLLQEASKSDQMWSEDYERYFVQSGAYNNMKKYLNANYPPPSPSDPNYSQLFTEYVQSINPYLQANYDSLTYYHNNARVFADNYISPNGQTQGFVPYFLPGTERFDSTFNKITTSKSFSEGGSGFYDKSALYHIQGEYKFSINSTDLITGGNGRLYKPKSDGTIFSDTSGESLESYEFGVYAGLERKVYHDRLKINLTGRLDKNKNFDLLFSPAASLVYTADQNNIIRLSFGSAIRNPTLTDQYLYYNVGRAILVGNVSGYQSLVTIPSLQAAFKKYPPVIDSLEYFDIAPIQPEKVKTIELGYRASLFKKLYVDITAYYSVYRDFIGYKLAGQVDTSSGILGDNITIKNIFRISSNSEDIVNSQGICIGLNYYIGKYYSVSGNWSWNELNKRNSNDPIIPAYNTPKNKINLGFSGRDIEAVLFKKVNLQHVGFAVNYKWVQGFLYEGSPQFTGEIDDYALLDFQINKQFPKIKSTFKLGASNLLDNQHYEVYGGPLIGRLAYFSILVELN